MRILALFVAVLALSGCGWMFRSGNSAGNDSVFGNIVVEGNASAAGRPGPSGFPGGFGTNTTVPGPVGDNSSDMTADQGGAAGPPRSPVPPPGMNPAPPSDQGVGKPTDDQGDGDQGGGDQGDDGGKPTDGGE